MLSDQDKAVVVELIKGQEQVFNKKVEGLKQELMQSLTSLQSTLNNFAAKQDKAPEAATAPADKEHEQHPTGFCGDPECKSCMSQATEIYEVGVRQSRESTLEEIDEALLLAAGEEMRQRITQLVAKGIQLRNRRNQEVSVVA